MQIPLYSNENHSLEYKFINIIKLIVKLSYNMLKEQ